MSAAVGAKASDAAERSQRVYFANLKEDMLLDKHFHVIRRAEKSLVHRIAIDQKIIFRRFQAKLRRSKIALARLWGDKDEERELRARDLHVMNTNCGQDLNDFEFLKKLERRPCVVDEDDEKITEAKETVQGGEAVTDEDTEELLRSIMEEQALRPSEKNLRSLSAIGRLMDEARLTPGRQDSDTPTRAAANSATRGLRPPPAIKVRPVTAPESKPGGTTTTMLNDKASRIGAKQQRGSPLPHKVNTLSDSRAKKLGHRRLQTSPPPSPKTSSQKRPTGTARMSKIRPQSSLGLNPSLGKSRVNVSQSAQNATSSHSTSNSRAKSARAASTSIRGSSAGVKTKPSTGVQGSSSSADSRTKSASGARSNVADSRLKPASGVRTNSVASRTKSASGIPVSSDDTTRAKPMSGVHRNSADTRAKRTHGVRCIPKETTRTQSPYEDPPYTLSPRIPTGRRRSVRGSLAGDESQPASPSMFEEQKKIDWVALRLEEARSTDLTPKVSAFLKTLLDLDKKDRLSAGQSRDEYCMPPDYLGPPLPPTDPETEMARIQTKDGQDQGENEEEERKTEELKGDRKFDYYATKMALQAASVKRDRMMSLPGTPEEVNMKLVGDSTIKSITMPRLYVDYDHVTLDEDDGEEWPPSYETPVSNVLVLH